MDSIINKPISETIGELSKVMISSVYPKLFELMELCHIKTIEINNPGWVPLTLNAEENNLSYQQYSSLNPNPTPRRIISLNPKDAKGCSFLEDLTDVPDNEESFSKQEEEIKKHISYCKILFNKIDELESFFNDIDFMTSKAKKMKFHYQREVLTEKYIQEEAI